MTCSGAPDAPGAPGALPLSSVRGCPPLPVERGRFAVVDVETSGVRFERGGRIVELAVAILEGGTIHLAWHALVDPGTALPPFVTRLTGITDGLLAGRPGFADVAPALARALEAGGFVPPHPPVDWPAPPAPGGHPCAAPPPPAPPPPPCPPPPPPPA